MKRLRNLNFSDYFLIFLGIFNVLPLLAPIFLNLGLMLPAKIIYFIYSFTCHQIHWRSLHIGDHQCAWCSRCMAMWLGTLLMAVTIKVFNLRGFKFWYIIPFAIPIALDGGIQSIATVLNISGGDTLYISTNLMRWITGGIFGIGLGGVLMGMIRSVEVIELGQKFTKLKSALGYLPYIALVGSALGMLYVLMMLGWNFTSTDYKPTNFFDSKIPAGYDAKSGLQRRGTAVCPVTIGQNSINANDVLGLNCFGRLS